MLITSAVSLELFEKDKVERVKATYRAFVEMKKDMSFRKMDLAKLEKNLGNQKKIEENFNIFLTKLDSNPILSKMKQTTPDFTKLKLSTMGMDCPLVYYIERLKSVGSLVHSDLATASNYKFSKQGSDTLVMKVGDMEYTFIKAGNGFVNVAVIKGKNSLGKLETSKNTIGNNWHAMELCLQHQNMR